MALSSQGSTVCFCTFWQLALLLLIFGNVYYFDNGAAPHDRNRDVVVGQLEGAAVEISATILPSPLEVSMSKSVSGTCRVSAGARRDGNSRWHNLVDKHLLCVSADFGDPLPPLQSPLETLLNVPKPTTGSGGGGGDDGQWVFGCPSTQADQAVVPRVATEQGASCPALLVRQGGCSFIAKARHARASGHCALVVVVREDADPFPMGTDEAAEADKMPLVAVSIARSAGMELWRRIVEISRPVQMALHANGTQLEQLEWALEESVRVRAVQRARAHGASQRQTGDGQTGHLSSAGDKRETAAAADGEGEVTTTTTIRKVVTSANGDVAEELTTTTVTSSRKEEHLLSEMNGATARAKRPLAVFTQVRDEKVFLPRWVRYYASQLESLPGRLGDDLFVLDHESSDGSTDIMFAAASRENAAESESWSLPPALALEGGVVVVRNGGVHDHGFLRDNVQVAQKVLLRHYEWVLFAEADEFVMVNASSESTREQPTTLLEYVRSLVRTRQEAEQSSSSSRSGIDLQLPDVVTTVGWEPFQQPHEVALDLCNGAVTKPWLLQRSVWRESVESCKPALVSRPVRYCYGFHRICCGGAGFPADTAKCLAATTSQDPALLLVHLHRIDYAYTRARHEQRAKQRWSSLDVSRGYSAHQLVVDGKEFDDFYYNPATLRETRQIDELLRRAV